MYLMPKSLKTALIRLLLKKTGLDSVSNLTFISKVIENVVSGRLNEHLNKNSMFDPLQSAYRDKHSTETALIKVQNDILSALDTGSSAILLMLDLSAAFDTIDHDILLSRLCNIYGITGDSLDWFRWFQRQQPTSGGTVRSSDLQIVVNTSLQTVSSTVFRTRVSLQRLS